jgi:signal transduction histidine kinase/ActR/RegA family two-component response regulator
MRMPGLDGMQTIQALWRDDPRLQVVLCTAYSDRSWSELCAVLGVTDRLLVLRKPFDPVEVVQLALALGEKWRLAREGEAALRARDAFLAAMSHEIRTPLNGILGMAELLVGQPGLDPGMREPIETIHRSGQGLLAVLNDIIDHARLAAGMMPVADAPFAPADLVRDVAALFAARAAERGIGLAVEPDPDLPPHLRGDAGRLRQVVANLVSNAVKFTRSGGVLVTARWGGDELVVAVRDSGIGIPPGELERLFQPFVQVESGSARRYDGSGLGLAISRRLAELMGGGITVESTVGTGSTFTLRARCPRSAPGGTVAAPAAPPAGLRVLVAEDNPVNQRVAAAMLRRLEAVPTVVGDGDAALAALDHGAFDLVLMDIHMPVRDGFAACAALRAREASQGALGPRGRRMPVIAVTADAMAGDRERFLASGMDDHLPKPITLDGLAAVLRRWA